MDASSSPSSKVSSLARGFIRLGTLEPEDDVFLAVLGRDHDEEDDFFLELDRPSDLLRCREDFESLERDRVRERTRSGSWTSELITKREDDEGLELLFFEKLVLELFFFFCKDGTDLADATRHSPSRLVLRGMAASVMTPPVSYAGSVAASEDSCLTKRREPARRRMERGRLDDVLGTPASVIIFLEA